MILFSDFDDTLFIHNDPSMLRRNLDAIQNFRAKGNRFCITTGRELLSLESSLPNPSEYCDYIILNNGSVCVDSAQQVVFTIPMTSAEVGQLIEFLCSSPDFAKLSPVYYYDLDSGEKPETYTTKIRLWVNSNDLADRQSAEISSEFGDAFQVFTYHNMEPHRNWIPGNYKAFSEAISGHAGKESAITKLAAMFNIPNSEIITVGDDWNDLKMIQKFDGYIIANSKPEVLSQVAPSHAVASVAELIDNLLK